jgi:hypothetical protein
VTGITHELFLTVSKDGLACTTLIITSNVPLFRKLRDIIFFLWHNNFMSHFEGTCCGGQDIFGWGGLLVAMLCEQVFRGRGLVGGRTPPPPPTIKYCRYTWMLAGGWGGAI